MIYSLDGKEDVEEISDILKNSKATETAPPSSTSMEKVYVQFSATFYHHPRSLSPQKRTE